MSTNNEPITAPSREVILSTDSRVWAAALNRLITDQPALVTEDVLELWMRHSINTGFICGTRQRTA